jgi:hypothetical protein
MSRIHLLPIILSIFSGLTFSIGIQPAAIACQPVARIVSKGANRPKGSTVCAHERVALNVGTTSVKLTCLTNQKQIDFKGGSAFMACSAQRSAQFMRCPTDKQMICVEPKGNRKGFQLIQTATHLSWVPIPDVTDYKVILSGHGVFWQGKLSEPSLNYQEIAGLTPGNAYLVKVESYRQDTYLSSIELPLNVPRPVTTSFQSK